MKTPRKVEREEFDAFLDGKDVVTQSQVVEPRGGWQRWSLTTDHAEDRVRCMQDWFHEADKPMTTDSLLAVQEVQNGDYIYWVYE